MSPTGSRLRALTEEYQQLAARLRQGGGAARVEKMHQQGKLAPARAGGGVTGSRIRPGSSWGCWWRTISMMGRLPVPA